MKAQLEPYFQELNHELRNILNYWIKHTIDHDHGGFYGRIDHFNQVDKTASKGVVLNARILWTFSAAYNFLNEKKYLDMAHRAYQYLKDYFQDDNNGGLVWEVDYLGNPINSRKQIYAQGFGIYGFSEYYRASRNKESLSFAISLFRKIEKYSYDPEYGGYLEAFDQQWKGLPDMRLPIQYALSFPGRLPSDFERFSFMDYPELSFGRADTKIFRNLAISYEALSKGGNWPCILNAANEVAVEAFLEKRIGFLEIPDVIENTLGKLGFIKTPELEDYFNTDLQARQVAKELI